MPYAPRHPCGFPSCPELVPHGTRLCPRHESEAHRRYNAQRPAQDAFYGTAYWKALRDAHLAAEPFCRMCQAEGRYEPGVVVDHITPRAQGGPDEDGNLQSLCRLHDNQKRAREGR